MTEVNATNAVTASLVKANSGTINDTSRSDLSSWYEAMAKAWGGALDSQASKITALSDSIGSEGQDNPSTLVMLTTESLRMQFLSNNASTATTSVGQALEALARK